MQSINNIALLLSLPHLVSLFELSLLVLSMWGREMWRSAVNLDVCVCVCVHYHL